MTLQQWLKANNVTFGDFASRIGASNATVVRRYAFGERTPRRNLLEAIVRETGGQVQPNDFYAQPATAE